jgi:hypothetical protein
MTPGVLRDSTHNDRRLRANTEPAITRTSAPFDPALRLALIEAGIITIQQLSDAEEKLLIVAKLVTDKIEGESDGAEPSSVDEDSSSG